VQILLISEVLHYTMVLSFLFLISQQLSQDVPTVPNPAEVSYYSGLPVSNWPTVRSVEAVFLDYDGTIEIGDALSPAIFQRLGAEADGDPSQPYSGAQLISEFNTIKEETGDESFKTQYFGGSTRVEELRTAIETLRDLTSGEVNMLSARWDPITGEEWAIYVHHVVNDYMGLGFTLPHVIGVDVKLSTGAYDKGGFMKRYLDSVGKSNANAVHADNSFKYIHSIMGNEADFLWVKTANGITKESLDLLITRASGDMDLESSAPSTMQIAIFLVLAIMI